MSDSNDQNSTGAPGDRKTREGAGETRELPGDQRPHDLTETLPDQNPAEETAPARRDHSAPETDELAPEIIDERYLVRSLLGEGSMGNVYKVHDRQLDEVVALKTLHGELVRNDAAVERFRREVKLARRVTHPNVARIYEFGLQDDVPYLTMEFIDGESLGDILEREGALNSSAVRRYIGPICRGLHAAHEAEVVHRDLKPENIMVDAERVVLTDFGIARAVTRSDQFSLTRDGLVGTPAYMAPEQIEPDAEIDARTDVYSVGVLLYRMLTGTFPWNETSAMAMAFERCERPAPELPEDGNWPDAYREVVHCCLQRDPDRRYDDITQVAAGLRRASNPAFSTYPPGRHSSGSFQTDDLGSSTHRTGMGREVGLESLSRDKTLAVLPLEHVGPDDLEYRAVGFTEEVLDELSRDDGLAVLPRGAVREYRDRNVDPRVAGRELDVQLVVEGSVRQHDGAVNVRLAAISVKDGFQIWAERFEAPPGQLLNLGSEVADAIRDALTVDPADHSFDPPADPRAVDLYMRARHELYERWFSDLAPAIGLFERALDRAPDDPRILSGLATARARAAFVDAGRRDEHLREARTIADRAIEIAPGWPQPHFALAKVHYNRVQFGPALEEVERALEIAPDFSEAHALRGRIIAEIGPLETAARHLDRALELNPNAYSARWDLARVEALRGRWNRVDDLLERPVDSDLQTVLRYANRTRLDLWRASPQWIDSHPPEALPRGSDFEKLTPIMRKVTRGEPFEPTDRETLEVAISNLDADSRYLSLQYQFRTEIGMRAGDRSYALDALEQSVRTGLVDRNWLEEAPILDPLRGTDRFREALRRVRQRIDERLAHSSPSEQTS